MNSITGNMKHIQYILMMTVIVLLAACSQDVADEQAQEPDAALRLAGVTRSITGDQEYSDIRIFLTNGTTATEGLFKYAGESSWTTQLKLKSGARTYQLYGYMPDDAEFDTAVKVIHEQIDIVLALTVVIEAEGSAHGRRLVVLVSRLAHTRHNAVVLLCHRRQLLDVEHGAILVPVGNAVCKSCVVRHIAI